MIGSVKRGVRPIYRRKERETVLMRTALGYSAFLIALIGGAALLISNYVKKFQDIEGSYGANCGSVQSPERPVDRYLNQCDYLLDMANSSANGPMVAGAVIMGIGVLIFFATTYGLLKRRKAAA